MVSDSSEDGGSVMRRLAALTALAGMACASDTPGREAGSGFTTRDSLGVEIVESHEPVWAPGEGWRVSDEPLFVIRASDGSEENILLDPASVDVDTRGRIIVADGYQAGWDEVLVFDSTGSLERRMGGEGRGPGEFGQLWWAEAYRGDSIVAFDMSGDRLSIFGPEGRFARMVRQPSLPMPERERGVGVFTAGVEAAFGDGHFLAYPFGLLDVSEGPGPAWFRHELLRLSPDGEAFDSLGSFEIYEQHWDGTRQSQRWFGAQAVHAVGEDFFWFGRGDRYELRRYDAGGSLTRILRRAWEPRPVTDELKGLAEEWYLDLVGSSPEASDEILERVRQSFASASFAETLPPYSNAILDEDGYLWVESWRWISRTDPSPERGPTAWSVFDPAGYWLGDVEVPAGFIMREVTRSRALGFVVDDFGVKEIYVYGLDRTDPQTR